MVVCTLVHSVLLGSTTSSFWRVTMAAFIHRQDCWVIDLPLSHAPSLTHCITTSWDVQRKATEQDLSPGRSCRVLVA